jgi:signal recognition particle subunit SRP54
LIFVGMGETTDKLEPFRAEGMASRVLGMGDVVGLMQDFEEVVDQKKAEADAARMMQGQFTLDDFLNQVRTIQKMGSLKDLMEKIPGLGGMMPPGAAANLDDSELGRIEAMIQSMTRAERDDPNVLVREPSRVARIAKGSAQPAEGVSELVQRFLFMRQMMGGMGGGDAGGLLSKIPGMGGLNMARNMRRAMKSGKMQDMMQNMGGMGGMGGMPGMPGLGGMPGFGGMPGMGGFPGMPGLGDAGSKMRVLSKGEKNQKKNQRKRERDARKKSKGKK